jgi:plasmid stabilization system protein ParE
MRREVIWTWAAEVDAQNAFMHMEESAPGSGLRLVALTESLVALLQEFPYMCPVWRHPFRKARLRRTHYGLFYAVEPGRLVITGLQDLRRDPDRLRQEMLRRLP